MKFTIIERGPYVYTYEDREYLNLVVEYLSSTEVEVTGPAENIEQWVTRTKSIPLSDEEYFIIDEKRKADALAAEELDYEVQRAFEQAKIEDAERTRLLNAQGPLAQSS